MYAVNLWEIVGHGDICVRSGAWWYHLESRASLNSGKTGRRWVEVGEGDLLGFGVCKQREKERERGAHAHARTHTHTRMRTHRFGRHGC